MCKALTLFKKFFKCLISSNMGRIGLSFIWILTFLSINTITNEPILIWIATLGVITLIISVISGTTSGWVTQPPDVETKKEDYY